MDVVIAIVVTFVVFAAIVGLGYWVARLTKDDRRAEMICGFAGLSGVLQAIGAWAFALNDSWFAVVLLFGSLFAALLVFSYMTNWRGWGTRVWGSSSRRERPRRSPPFYYAPPRSRVARVVGYVVLVATLGNAVALLAVVIA
jgi:hypothetical protein